jgi:predicted PurR-regulated permease PerM
MKLLFQSSFIILVLALIITISIAINSSSFSQEENTQIQQQQQVNKYSQSEIKKLTDNKYDWSNVNENVISNFNSNISYPKIENTTSINQTISINRNLVDNSDEDNASAVVVLGAWAPF